MKYYLFKLNIEWEKYNGYTGKSEREYVVKAKNEESALKKCKKKLPTYEYIAGSSCTQIEIIE